MEKNTGVKLPENLVALIYAPNSCYCRVVDYWIKGLEIDEDNMTWSYKNPSETFFRKHTPIQIGKCNHSMKNCSFGVIGIYDRTKIDQLDQMVGDWQSVNSEDRNFED